MTIDGLFRTIEVEEEKILTKQDKMSLGKEFFKAKLLLKSDGGDKSQRGHGHT